jgi:hypothetical protein
MGSEAKAARMTLTIGTISAGVAGEIGNGLLARVADGGGGMMCPWGVWGMVVRVRAVWFDCCAECVQQDLCSWELALCGGRGFEVKERERK